MTHLGIADSIRFVERYGYLLLFAWVFAEQGALPVPSAPLLIAVGAVIRDGHLNAAMAIGSCVAGALLADNIWFQLGRRRGKRVLKFLCRVSLEPDSCVRQTENAFIKYGLKTLLIVKFIPGLNTVAAPLAGDSGIRTASFLIVDTLGILLWSGSFMSLGYLFRNQLEIVLDDVQGMGSGFLVLVAGLIAAWILWKFVQRRRFLHQWKGARITPEELRERMDAGEDLFIVDLRRPDEDHDTIPGSVRLSVAELVSDASGVPRDREIILFCSCPNETSSAKLAILLRSKGITRVRPLRGGSGAWIRMMQSQAQGQPSV
jgi:membrane protein DedA with SNARE-associated domain/rhodanese-related sulfurtransferase